MTIYKNIQDLIDIASTFDTQQKAEVFLSRYDDAEKTQLMVVLYLGRDIFEGGDILDTEDLVSDFENRKAATLSLVPKSHFARILMKKRSNIEIYLTSFLERAQTTSFDMSRLK